MPDVGRDSFGGLVAASGTMEETGTLGLQSAMRPIVGVPEQQFLWSVHRIGMDVHQQEAQKGNPADTNG